MSYINQKDFQVSETREKKNIAYFSVDVLEKYIQRTFTEDSILKTYLHSVFIENKVNISL